MPDPLAAIARWDRFCDRWLPPPPPSNGTKPTAGSDDPWREDPQPIQQFLREHLGTELFPAQAEEIEKLVGPDPKKLFERSTGLPQQALYLFGKGCLGPDECLTDLASGQTKTVSKWAEDGRSLLLRCWDETSGHIVEQWTTPVFKKGDALLYRVTLAYGRSFVATAEHQCLSPQGWLPVGRFQGGRTHLRSLYGYAPVVQVEAIGYGRFYDLTVPEIGNYFDSNGILHSNSGKDYMVSCLMIWAVHVLLCLHDPAIYLGLAPDENIDIVTVAVNLQQARNVLFFKVKQRLKGCTWFRDRLSELLPADISVDKFFKEGNGWVGAENIRFPGNIRLWTVCSNASSFEGLNPILFCCDEISGFTSETELNKAKGIHETLETSARTRYGDRWKGVLITFPRHKGDYAVQLHQMYERGRLSGFYASRKATWEINPKVTRESLQPFYDKDPESAKCRFECEPPAAIDAYFRSPELLLLHASGAPLPLLQEKLDLPPEQLQILAQLGQNPITEIDASGDPVLDRRGFPKLARWVRGQKDLAGRDYEYYVHLDPGLSNDAFGLAIGHNHQMSTGALLPTVDLCFRWTGAMFAGFGQISRYPWFVDSIAQTEEITAAEVDFRTVREFLYFLRHARGFNIRQVSMDNWNSAESKQELQKRDFECINRVVAKEDYDEFKALAYNRQIRYYAYPVLIEEFYKLQIISGTKVDAPRSKEGEGIKNDSHKDVSDAVAAIARYLAFSRSDTLDFYQLPELDELAKKEESQPVTLGTGSAFNDEQKLLMERFFGE